MQNTLRAHRKVEVMVRRQVSGQDRNLIRSRELERSTGRFPNRSIPLSTSSNCKSRLSRGLGDGSQGSNHRGGG